MEVDSDNELLRTLAAGGSIDIAAWPELRSDILARLDKIAHEEFPIPKLPQPPPILKSMTDADGRLLSPSSTSTPDASQDADKENAPVDDIQNPEHEKLPKQLEDMLVDIKTFLASFEDHPPHSIQRTAELILRPRAHYKALAPFLHAVDRVVNVTSGSNIFPLPPAIPDMSQMIVEGDEGAKDPAASVAWSNPTAGSLGTDDTLGGALLTPIPWLVKNSRESSPDTPGAQIHTEGTETIDGPNGMGSIETVSVSVNGIPSAGHTRGITQGELLRQEQREVHASGVQPPRSQDSHMEGAGEAGEPRAEGEGGEDEDEAPHARGPQEIGVGDLGPQSVTTSYIGEGGLETQGIDVEAAVGRKHEDDGDSSATQGNTDVSENQDTEVLDDAGSPEKKREGEQGLESDVSKKIKVSDVEGDTEEVSTDKEGATATTATSSEPAPKPDAGEEGAAQDQEDKMDTDK